MKRKWTIPVLIALAAVLLAAFIPDILYRQSAESDAQDQDPLAAVSAAQIEKIIIEAQSGRQCELPQDDMAALSSLIEQIEPLGEGDQSYLNYDGVFPTMFHIYFDGGTQMDFSASNPFYVIDSVGYRSEYKLCDTISRLYWQLCEDYFPKPPRKTAPFYEKEVG